MLQGQCLAQTNERSPYIGVPDVTDETEPCVNDQSATSVKRIRYPSHRVFVVLFLVFVILLASTGVFIFRDHIWGVRADARAAVHALENGNLASLEKQLSNYRGQPGFAYYFAASANPRSLGDALSTVAGSSQDTPFGVDVDVRDYEVILTDLAGVLALATHGGGDRRLPDSWAEDFATAATTPKALYGTHDESANAELREKQDTANRANLLLLLARGYWSPEFLQTVAKQFYEFELAHGDDSWPSAQPSSEIAYAPAPSGVYLTDGIVALTAALTANPLASEWAFTEFLPGTSKIAGTDHEIGRFTHFLMFEHHFPRSPEDASVGVTATLTALSSAVSSSGQIETEGIEAPNDQLSNRTGPFHDAVVLQAIAQDLTVSGCSWNITDWGHCLVDVAHQLWSWIQTWGHTVLDVLTLATFAPFPFNVVGIAASAVNATWFALESDYTAAGLSLAAAIPGLALGKVAQTAKTASQLPKGASTVANVARSWFPQKIYRNCGLAAANGGITLKYGANWTLRQRRAADKKIKATSDAARRGETVKTPVERRGAAVKQFRADNRKPPSGDPDVDHTIDLQLGGLDNPSNLKYLDATVNRSLGKQLDLQLRRFADGDRIPAVAICR